MKKLLRFVRLKILLPIQNLWYELVTSPVQKRRKDKLLYKIIAYQLKLANVNISTKNFLEYAENTKEAWYDKYSFTDKQQEKLEKYIKKELKKIYPFFTDNKIQSEASKFILAYGFSTRPEKYVNVQYVHVRGKFLNFHRVIRDKQIQLGEHFLMKIVGKSTLTPKKEVEEYIKRNYNYGEFEIDKISILLEEEYKILKHYL